MKVLYDGCFKANPAKIKWFLLQAIVGSSIFPYDSRLATPNAGQRITLY